MMILSLNSRDLGGRTKSLSLRALFSSLKPDIILLQETMCSDSPALIAFSKLLPSWEYCAISAKGLSGGLLSAWNPSMVNCKAYHTCAGILLQASIRGMPAIPLNILNVYGPYRDRELFWDNALRGGILNLPHLVIGGDLNLILRSSEFWGVKASLDPLSNHFLSLFESIGLVDVAPSESGPTWRNGRAGSEGISKRLDRFLISNSLIPSLGAYKTWIKCLDLSDHFPIVFEWNTWKGSHDYHFKFNRSWLEDPDFIAWFMREWASSFNPDSIDDIENLCLSLRKLKSATKRWTKEKFDSLVLESTNLELAIESILAGPTKGILSSEQIVSLSLLNAERHRILQHFLLTWQLKSRIK